MNIYTMACSKRFNILQQYPLYTPRSFWHSLSHSLFLSLSHSLTHSYSYTHTHTHTFSFFLFCSHSLIRIFLSLLFSFPLSSPFPLSIPLSPPLTLKSFSHCLWLYTGMVMLILLRIAWFSREIFTSSRFLTSSLLLQEMMDTVHQMHFRTAVSTSSSQQECTHVSRY